jgi:hypothetical protein
MDEGEVRIANIGVKNQQMRRNFGLIALAIGIIIGLGLLLVDVPAWTRLGLFLPFYAGFIGIFQAKEKT